MLPVSPLEYLVNKVTPDYHAMIDLLGGKQSDTWKEKSAEMAMSLKEMNDREARKNQVVHNRQGQNMHKLQDQWQELMGYARNLGLYCFAMMVTSDPGNASAFSQNAVIYNDEIVGSFLKDHLDLLNLKGHFYRHILLATDQPDAALAYQGEEKKLKGEVECRNRDSVCMAAMNTLKKLISKQLRGWPISHIDWKQLPWNLIKWTLSIKNCPSDFVTMLEKGADIYSTSQWQSLYNALGGADPDGEYAQDAQVPSSRLVDVTLWTLHDLALDPSSDDYRNIVLIRDDSGLGGIGGVLLLFIKDVMKDSSMRPQKRHTVPSLEDAGNCSHPSTSTSSQPKKIYASHYLQVAQMMGLLIWVCSKFQGT